MLQSSKSAVLISCSNYATHCHGDAGILLAAKANIIGISTVRGNTVGCAVFPKHISKTGYYKVTSLCDRQTYCCDHSPGCRESVPKYTQSADPLFTVCSTPVLCIADLPLSTVTGSGMQTRGSSVHRSKQIIERRPTACTKSKHC